MTSCSAEALVRTRDACHLNLFGLSVAWSNSGTFQKRIVFSLCFFTFDCLAGEHVLC